MSLSDDRRAALVAARSAVLARTHLGLDVAPEAWSEFARAGAAVVAEGHAVIDLGNAPGTGLGAGLLWATRHDATSVDLIVDPDAADRDPGAIARQAGWFEPPPRVWVLRDGPDLVAATPVELVPPLVAPPAEQVLLLRQAGCEVVIEDGEVIGEVRGLEVARVVLDPDGTARIEVGVGRFDREIFGMLHGELSPPEALARVVEQIAALRAPGAEPHPVNRLARERWLRDQLIRHPDLVGASRLEAVERPRSRAGLRGAAIAGARGERPDGRRLIVAATVGVDLDAVADAADTRSWHDPDAELVIALPTGDLHPVVAQLAERLAVPAGVVAIDPEWSR